MQEPCQGGGNETHSHLARSRPSSRKTLRKFKNAIKALKIKNPITAPKSIPSQKQSLTIKTRHAIIFHNWRKNFMYTPYLTNYQYHFPTESDRVWLEEALVGQDHFSAEDAITLAAACDETQNIFKISRIISRQSDNERLCWMLHQVIKPESIVILAVATHPNFRGQKITKAIGAELVEWQKQVNPWNLKRNIIAYKPTFINAPSAMYNGNWNKYPGTSSGFTIEEELLQ